MKKKNIKPGHINSDYKDGKAKVIHSIIQMRNDDKCLKLLLV